MIEAYVQSERITHKKPPVFLSETGGLFIFHSAIVANGGKNANHLRDKLNILDYTLTAEETVKIATLDSGSRYYHRA